MPVALTIAGSDPSGGAGIQADLKTFHQFGAYGEAVITLLAVENTRRAGRVEVLPAGLVMEQLEAVLEDIPPAAAKTGALGAREIVSGLARAAERFRFPLVVDPVLIGKQGQALLDSAATAVLRDELLPRAALITPNVPEAEVLSGLSVRGPEEMRHAAEILRGLGARAVLIKGGHLGEDGDVLDLLLEGGTWHEFPTQRLATRHTHGTGCTYSAAITAGLAFGQTLPCAVARAKRYVHEAIRFAPGLGSGCGPLNHHAEVR
jgi:hydroxymethylpyrimidine/phosphomethylpyrimidine kinase